MSVSTTFRLGGELGICRLGYGAMRIVGPGVWGPPPDPDGAVAVLRRARELGVDFVDTADSYGLGSSEETIRAALHPYGGVRIATKAGILLPRPAFAPPPVCGNPDYLRQQLELSLRRLGVDEVDLWQLHRIDPAFPADDQFGVLKEALDAGKARYVGLSGVSVAELEQAQRIVPIATVQNMYNVAHRESEALLRPCETSGVGFIAFFPLNGGGLAGPGGPLSAVAERRQASAEQVALAWLLQRSPNLIAIPGTTSVAHLEQNMAGASLELDAADVQALDEAVEQLVTPAAG